MKNNKQLSTAERKSLRDVLVKITREGNPKLDVALSELEHAISAHKAMARALLVTGGGPTRFSAKKLRIELKALVTNLTKARNVTATTSIPAQCMFNPSEWRELTERLKDATAAAERALGVAENIPSRDKNNFSRTVLAWKVALVLRDILDVRPASTRHDHIKMTGTRGGAKYSQVLEVVLDLAVGSSTDLQKIISAGLAALKDPDFPPFTPSK